MTLPADVARCTGHMASQHMGGPVTVNISVGRAECVRCLRRTSAPEPGQQPVYMQPPAWVAGRCEARIDPSEEPHP